MSNKRDTLIVLDSLKYLEKEPLFKDSLSDICVPSFYYTYYENNLIKYFHSLPFVGNFLSHISYWLISFNAAVYLFLFKRKIKLKIFINPIVAIFYCFLVTLFRRRESIVIAGFLFEDKRNKLYYTLRKTFVNFCYSHVYKIVVYSKNEVDFYSQRFPKLASKFVFVKYGRDFDIFEENIFKSENKYVASGGFSNRDFSTLIEAFNLLEPQYPNLRCKIATRSDGTVLKPRTANVEILYNVRIDTFGSFLSESTFVAIPLADTYLSAGHMALLEAMYRKKIVVITDIPAVRDYVNEDLVYFYKPGDAQNLANVLEYIYQNLDNPGLSEKAENAKKFYDLHYDFNALLHRIIKQCEGLYV